jgi:hypothetical protein
MKYGTREEVASSLELSLISVAGMKKVDRQHFENFANYQYPSAFLNEVRDTRQAFLKNVIKVQGMYTAVLFDKSEAGDLSTKLNSLVNLGLTAILTDVTRGGKAYNTTVVAIDTDEGFMAPHCVAILTIQVLYLSQR